MLMLEIAPLPWRNYRSRFYPGGCRGVLLVPEGGNPDEHMLTANLLYRCTFLPVRGLMEQEALILPPYALSCPSREVIIIKSVAFVKKIDSVPPVLHLLGSNYSKQKGGPP